ncbi:hypothetical protein COO60DRAFT_1545724 [Scenedesmus sp. NREL 46B-D3]|nr:hypothetical protein COO60DRAFT_1545724 [Scenedesmus sp. NREL 46B-D3]
MGNMMMMMNLFSSHDRHRVLCQLPGPNLNTNKTIKCSTTRHSMSSAVRLTTGLMPHCGWPQAGASRAACISLRSPVHQVGPALRQAPPPPAPPQQQQHAHQTQPTAHQQPQPAAQPAAAAAACLACCYYCCCCSCRYDACRCQQELHKV